MTSTAGPLRFSLYCVEREREKYIHRESLGFESAPARWIKLVKQEQSRHSLQVT